MVELDVERIDYERYTNRQLMTVPLVVLAVALLVIAGWFVVTGSPVNPGIEFTGGTEIQLVADATQSELRAAFDAPIESIRPIPAAEDTFIVTFQSTDAGALEGQARAAGYTVTSVQSTSPSFGGNTQQLALLGVGTAFVGMSIVAFILFRTAVPSLAIVVSAFSDIVVPVAIMNLLGIKLSLGTVAALLMLIGYSVDSDILLTNHVLRRRGGFYESAYRAMQTGVTMTLTSLSAAVVMALTASLFGIELLTAIGTVLALGLATDLLNTYMFNLGLLRWYRGLDA
ncbi:MAG: protein translocase subunit SecF [Halobacteriales archaeon]|nr:protein translocase subunit SecF [Halobacteriales archaeon]